MPEAFTWEDPDNPNDTIQLTGYWISKYKLTTSTSTNVPVYGLGETILVEGLVKQYEEIAKSVSLPKIVYSVKSRTGVNIEPNTCLKLSKIENIVAIKEASGDLSQIAKIANLCKDELFIVEMMTKYYQYFHLAELELYLFYQM